MPRIAGTERCAARLEPALGIVVGLTVGTPVDIDVKPVGVLVARYVTRLCRSILERKVEHAGLA
jgi:hypothetical protein